MDALFVALFAAIFVAIERVEQKIGFPREAYFFESDEDRAQALPFTHYTRLRYSPVRVSISILSS